MAPRTAPTAAECAAAGRWIAGDDNGMSSRTLMGHMLGGKLPRDSIHHPYDPADLGRCLRLLALIPTWKPRMPEMAALSPEWGVLAAAWDRLEATMDAEVGIDWSKGQKAPQTYALMKQILASAPRARAHAPMTAEEAATRMADAVAARAAAAAKAPPPPQDA